MQAALQLSLQDASTPKKGCKRSQTVVELDDSPASRTRSKVGGVTNEERSREATLERGVLSISERETAENLKELYQIHAV